MFRSEATFTPPPNLVMLAADSACEAVQPRFHDDWLANTVSDIQAMDVSASCKARLEFTAFRAARLPGGRIQDCGLDTNVISTEAADTSTNEADSIRGENAKYAQCCYDVIGNSVGHAGERNLRVAIGLFSRVTLILHLLIRSCTL